MIFVRWNRKVMGHLMYGVLAILADKHLGSESWRSLFRGTKEKILPSYNGGNGKNPS